MAPNFETIRREDFPNFALSFSNLVFTEISNARSFCFVNRKDEVTIKKWRNIRNIIRLPSTAPQNVSNFYTALPILIALKSLHPFAFQNDVAVSTREQINNYKTKISNAEAKNT